MSTVPSFDGDAATTPPSKGDGATLPPSDGEAAIARRPAAGEAAAAKPSADDEVPKATAPVDETARLRDALDEWIEATQRGDVAAQMRFYPARVPVFYTWRNVTREAIRAEKIKVFGAARHLDITTSAPAVALAQDRLTAVTRFRKRYVIEGPAIRRRGEVVQELRWRRTAAGWVIIGERDARVLRSS